MLKAYDAARSISLNARHILTVVSLKLHSMTLAFYHSRTSVVHKTKCCDAVFPTINLLTCLGDDHEPPVVQLDEDGPALELSDMSQPASKNPACLYYH